MKVIRKIKVKTADPDKFEDRDLGALAENIKCVFPLYDEVTGEMLANKEKRDLLSELIDYRDRFNNIEGNNNNIISSLDSLRDEMGSINNNIPKYSILYSNIIGEKHFIDGNTRIYFTNCQFKLYNKYLPIYVINNENELCDIYCSILNGTNKIEVYATLQLSFIPVRNDELNFTPEENEVYSKCDPILKNVKYYQTNLTNGDITELEENDIDFENRLTITQIKAVTIS